MASKAADLLGKVESQILKSDRPAFRVGDTVKVHNLIVEGQKERVQIFEGLVIKRSKGYSATATFTVRKVSYHIGVERTFFVHSPRIEKIELVARGSVRRARLFYLRPLRGRAAAVAREEVNPAQQAKAQAAKAAAKKASETAATSAEATA